MTRTHSRGRAAAVCTALLVLALSQACVAAPAAAPPAAALSPRLRALSTPALRAAPAWKQARGLSLAPAGPGSLERRGNRVVVEVHFARGAAAAAGDLRAAGAELLGVNRRYQTATVAAKPAQLGALAGVPRVESAEEVLAPVVAAAECGGLATSEGDLQLGSQSARSAFGVDGSGVGVGILSDSFDVDPFAATSAGQDVLSGDLPGPGNPCGRTTAVSDLQDASPAFETGDEGRAMAQIVHDLAPGARLSFATAIPSETLFAANIERLAAPVASGGGGAKVIVDDVFYREEPFFQDGPIAAAINRVTAGGAAYFTAAGNDNIVHGGSDVSSYEAPFRDAGACPTGVPAEAGSQCMDFDPGAGVDDEYDLEVGPGGQVQLDLQWAEPWFGVSTNLDAYLLDGVGNVLASSTGANGTRPFEFLFWENKGGSAVDVRLAIPRRAGTESPILKFVQIGNGRDDVVPTKGQLETSGAGDEIGPSVVGHDGAAAAVTAGAVSFDDSSRPEDYSSRGPVIHYFESVNPPLPAAKIVPQQVAKPDLVASDCVQTTFFGSIEPPGVRRFCGTSAAAPHAAAVAALMLQANPSLAYPELRSALAATARPVGAFGPDAVGAGLVDAYGAVSRVALAPAISITERPPALGRNRRPSVGFSANRPVAFRCSLDGGAPAPCSSPFVPPAPLADGEHGFVVEGTDAAGRVGRSELVGFRIDGRRPRTFFRHHPPKTVRTHKRRARVVFRFGSNEPDVTFACKIDSGFLRFCKPRLVRGFRPGDHVVSVKARDAAGNVDRSPAVFRFRVKRRG